MGDKVGIRGIAKLIGLTEGSTYGMSTAGKLPPPDGILDGKKWWFVSTIRKWDGQRRKNVNSRKNV